MKRLLTISAVLLLLTVPAWGQDYPKVEVFGGFSYLSADARTRESFFGWQASISANFHENVGFTFDSGGQYKTIPEFSRVGVVLSPGFTEKNYEFLLGPRFIIRRERFTGFAHTLIGLEYHRRRVFGDTVFAMGFGGGVDVNASERIAIRAFQLDYIMARHFGEWTRDRRLGAGVVFRFMQ